MIMEIRFKLRGWGVVVRLFGMVLKENVKILHICDMLTTVVVCLELMKFLASQELENIDII